MPRKPTTKGSSTTTTTPRVSRTREQVTQEFEEIRQETRTRPPADEKAEAALRERALAVKTATAGLSEDVVKELAETKLTLARDLDTVAEQYLSKLEALKTLNEAIEQAKIELANYHKIDVASTAIDQLVADYETKKRTLEEQMTSLRAAWDREQQERAQRVAEQNLADMTARKREAEQYEYQKTQERKKTEDAFNYQMAERRRQLVDEENQKVKAWTERETLIKNAETELNVLRTQVAQFPERIKAEVATAEKILSNVLKKDFDHQMALARKEAEANTSLLTASLASAKETIAAQVRQIESLSAQLDAARKQVADISVQAVQASSGRQTVEMLRDVTMAQAAGGTSTKKG